MTPLPPETLDALRRAAAARGEIVRLVLVERRAEPASEPPFCDLQLVVVLEEPPTEPPPRPFVSEVVAALRAVLPREGRFSFVIPSPVGIEGASRGGAVVYERGAA